MTTKRAVYDIAEFKALPSDGEETGRFEALVSVFGNVDLQGDRVVDGAFQKSIEEWRASGAPIPVIWSHDWANPNAHIGSADPNDVVEMPGKGLRVGGTIDLDNPFAAQVYRLLKERRVREFSFGYEVRKERKAKDGANELLDLGIIEVGPTLKGANPSTELLAVKSLLEDAAQEEAVDPAVKDLIDSRFAELRAQVGAHLVVDSGVARGHDTKAGRSISSKNESRIRAAVESLTEVLASLGDADEKAPEPDEADANGKATVDPVLLALQALIVNTKV